jgi:prepilin-type processing-associated H-X9-DG protein
MGQGVLIYCDDNDDRLPFAWYDEPSPKKNSFYALLCPQLFGAKFDGYGDFQSRVFLCAARKLEPLRPDHPVRISYGMNASNSVEFPKPETRRLSSVEAGNPGTTVLMADVQQQYNHPPIQFLDSSQIGYRHGGRANIAFYDGHVAAMPERDTNRMTLEF